MNFIKSVLIKLGTGFLYGIGFVLATAIFGVAATSYIHYEQKSANEEITKEITREQYWAFREYDEAARLSAHIAKEIITPEEFTLLGTIENNGDSTWSSIHLKAELFNEKGEFIDECTEYVSQKSTPGSTLNFKLSCGSCSKFQLRDYQSYKLIITDARHVR